MVTNLVALAVLARSGSPNIDLAAGSSLRVRLRAAIAVVCLLASASFVRAQTPVVFPNTTSTVAGGALANPIKGAACAAGSPFTATDALGDGCPASLALLGTTLYGEGTDNFGNIFFLDTGNEILHRVDARSGIMTVLAGGATTVGCTGQADKFGDNCLAATQTGAFNNPRV